VGNKSVGPYEFINKNHYSRTNVEETEGTITEDISLAEAKRSFEAIFKRLHTLDSSFERDDLDGTLCEGNRNENSRWKYDIYYLSDDGELQNVYKVVRKNSRNAAIMLYVGGHGGTQKWAPMSDFFNFFYEMDDLTTDSRCCLAFEKDADPSTVERWVRTISFNGSKNKYEYPTSGRIFKLE
jgi:hypothetical protein